MNIIILGVRIIEDSDNRGSDNRGCTVHKSRLITNDIFGYGGARKYNYGFHSNSFKMAVDKWFNLAKTSNVSATTAHNNTNKKLNKNKKTYKQMNKQTNN